jgi:EAL domain-containing protein (putative c-di-GMP-specific phosphodiesterase class I)
MSDAIENNRALFEIYNRNLQKFEEQLALKGFDIALINQIDRTKKELTRIDGEYADMTATHAPGSPETLKPLPLSLQKYDSFMIKFAKEFQEWNGNVLLTGSKFELSVIASLKGTEIAAHVFVARYADSHWKIVAEDAGVTAELSKLLERNSPLRDLLLHAAQVNHATVAMLPTDSKQCLFIPFLGNNRPQLLVIYELSPDFIFDTAIELILTTLLNATEYFAKPRPIEFIEPLIYNALKQKFGYVSEELYNRQYFLFNQRLETMTAHFEPIIFLSPDKPRIYGWEALAREPDKSVAPIDLFQTAELWGTRFKLQLDMYFLKVATAKYPLINEHGQVARKHHILPLSVNVYPESLIRTRYYETIKQIGIEGSMPLDSLFLEISEKLPIPIVDDISKDQHPIEAFREKLYQYMDLGIRFSIDDFGVGYASSSRLSRLGPACIKIDRDALSDRFGHFTFAYVIGLARRMPGYTQVIAEGIDNESMFSIRQLYELGVRYIQSHTFGRARPTVDNQLPKEMVQQIREALKGL